MPGLIKTIDQLAREKQRDVLWIRFHDWQLPHSDDAEIHYDTAARRQVLKFLDDNHIPYCPCFPIFSDGTLAWPYEGDVYVDIPFEPENPDFGKLSAFLEKDPSGIPTIDGAWFCAVSLERAMKYAYRDAPGYWDNP